MGPDGRGRGFAWAHERAEGRLREPPLGYVCWYRGGMIPEERERGIACMNARGVVAVSVVVVAAAVVFSYFIFILSKNYYIFIG